MQAALEGSFSVRSVWPKKFGDRQLLCLMTALVVTVGLVQPSAVQGASLPGNFAVSASGAATYKIPIAVPPGTAGMSPSLSLEYSSHASEGLVGVGWSLGGLPAIGRCPRTIAQDGVSERVNYDANDRFCLDGQRLVAVNGTYGTDGAEYRTELDNFSRVVSHGTAGAGPAWFEVHTKSGQIMHFGNSPDSRALVVGVATARLWALNKVSDTRGNYYIVSYLFDSANGELYPSRIDYSGSAATGSQPYNSVRFEYASRPPFIVSSAGGQFVKISRLLSQVKTFVGEVLVANYQITYDQGAASQSRRASSIQMCIPTGLCTPASVFAWQDGQANFASAGTLAGGQGDTDESGTGPRFLLMDLEGRGKKSIVIRDNYGTLHAYSWNESSFVNVGNTPTGLGYTTTTTGTRIMTMDVRGTGQDDYLTRDQYGNWYVYLANGSGFTYAGSFASGQGDTDESGTGPRFFAMRLEGGSKQSFVVRDNYGTLHAYSWNGSSFVNVGNTPTGLGYTTTTTGTRIMTMDVRGTGQDDYLTRDQYGNWHVYLANGSGFTYAGSFAGGQGDTDESGTGPRFFAMRLEGGSKQSFVIRDNYGTLHVYSWNGSSFVNVGNTPTGLGYTATTTGTRIITMDVRGTGQDDYLTRDQYGNWYVYLSTEVGFTYAGSFAGGQGDTNESGTGPRFFPMQVIGNGRTEFVIKHNTGDLVTWMWNGTSFVTGGQVATGHGYTTATTGTRILIGDITGEGKSGYLTRDAYGNWYFWRPIGPKVDVLSSITVNGVGTTATINYAPLSDGGVYQKDGPAAYPILNVAGPVYVVSRVGRSNGIAGSYIATYSYAGAKADLGGRGFLGFRQMKATDPQTGVVETTNYLQSFPYIGLVGSTSRSVGTQVLGQSTNAFQFSNAGNGATVSTPSVTSAPYRVSVSQKVDTRADLDGTAMPSTTSDFQYDAYGNATQVAVSNADGYGKTTNNIYINDTASWFLGRLTTSSVTAHAP